MLVNQSRKELRQWLAPPNPSINHNTACNTQHDGTAEWFIQGSTFDQWKTNGSLLWIRGNPGSGKSILCSAIIEEIKHIRKSRSALVAYYYFDFKDVAKRDVRGLLTSLLLQLVDGSDPCWDLLCQLHKTCCDGLEQPSEAALAQCLDSMLDLPFQIPTYIIIDALDECPNNTGTPSARERVLNFVQDLVQSNHSNLSICITSRPEHDINTALNPLTPPSRRVSLHEEGGQVEDINNFVRFFVLNDRTMRRWRAEDKELVIRVLSERAQGMFRWVYCQLDTLRRCVPSSIRKALNELPITLDDTYERILQGIPEEKFQHARRLFQCIVAAIRPLRVEELAEIFAIEFGPDAGPNLKEGWRPENPEDAVLSAISTLITIVENRGSKIVQFSHFSAREFLMSDRLRTSEIGNIRHYYVPLDAAYTVLARACLTVLLQLDENADKRHLETFPLAFYAAQHWVEHTMYEGVASRFKVHIEQLFNPSNPYLAAWTWIHDVDSDQVRETIDVLEERPTRPKATALYYAVLCGFSGLANYLIITHGEDVNAKCGYHGSSLHAASYMGHLDDARLLLAHGADVNMTNKREKTPLCSAYDGGHLGVMRLLLEYGADVDPYYDIASGLLSQEASFRGQADVVHLLLEHNADVNTRNVSNETPLHAALYCGLADVAGLLLQHGVDVNIRNVSNDTPLHVALYCGQADVVRLLLQHDADVNARNVSNDTPLHAASFRGLADVVYLLLQHNADVNARNVSNETPLHAALYCGQADVVHLLLQHNVDVNARNVSNDTPLHAASFRGRADVVRLLLQYNADVNARNVSNDTPLHAALYCGQADVVHLLLRHDADVNARNVSKDMPLHMASSMGHAVITQLLLEHGAVVDAQGRCHSTPLYQASESNHLEVVQVLLDHGGDIQIRGENDRTPFQAATSMGHVEVAELLLKYGADE